MNECPRCGYPHDMSDDSLPTEMVAQITSMGTRIFRCRVCLQSSLEAQWVNDEQSGTFDWEVSSD